MTTRLLFALILAALAALTLAPGARAGTKSPDQILDACIVEMQGYRSAAITDMDAVVTAFSTYVDQWLDTRGPSYTQLTREFAAAAARIERIATQATTRINRASTRCERKLIRMGAETRIITNLRTQTTTLSNQLVSLREDKIGSLYIALGSALFPG